MMRNLTLAAIFCALLVSCAEITDNTTNQGEEAPVNPDTAPVCVFNFTDKNDNFIEVAMLTVTSDDLLDSPVIVELDTPAKSVSVKLISKVNKITGYEFFVVASDGSTYRGVKQMYIPQGRRYEKTISLDNVWKKVKLKDGLVWHNYEDYEPITGEKQVVNVLELDMSKKNLQLEFIYNDKKPTISEVAKGDKGLIAITNASFGSGFANDATGVDNTFIRIDGFTHKQIDMDPAHEYYGKHESAVWYNKETSEVGFIDMPGDLDAALEYYKASDYPNLFSSYPMLVNDFQKADFSLYEKHVSSSSVGPRTVLALTKEKKLLLITIDGRWTDKAAGMTFGQLQDYLIANFSPEHAINMDGGGSTSMYIKGKGVVNYPCEGNSNSAYYNGTFKERGLVTFFAIREK